jgi:hypothetical protein
MSIIELWWQITLKRTELFVKVLEILETNKRGLARDKSARKKSKETHEKLVSLSQVYAEFCELAKRYISVCQDSQQLRILEVFTKEVRTELERLKVSL